MAVKAVDWWNHGRAVGKRIILHKTDHSEARQDHLSAVPVERHRLDPL